jgi:hypothetical protein
MELVHVAGMDVEPGYEGQVLDWYRDVLVPSLVRSPGWARLEQFECLAGEPRILSIFHLDREEVDAGDVVPFRDEARGRRIRNYSARTFRLVFEAGEHRAERDLINVVTTEAFPGSEEGFNDWYNRVHMPEILRCPGWIAGRRFACVDTPGLFLAVYDLEDAQTPFSTDEYESAVGWDDQLTHVRGYHGFRIYRRTASLPLGAAT